MNKLRVGVLMGGKSIEREVSFNSGRTICDHIDTMRYSIVPLLQTTDNQIYILPWHFLHRGKISDFINRLDQEATKISWDSLKKHVDFIYIAQHGRFAEDGTMQGFLEVLQIPYLGSKVLASALGMDKSMQKKFLKNAGIRVPESITLSIHEIKNLTNNYALLQKQMNALGITFPCIVKPYKEGSSFGVTIVSSPDLLMEAIAIAAHADPSYVQDVLIEEKIEGMEFSCIVITDYKTNTFIALDPTEVVVDTNVGLFDYEQKYMPGRATEYTPARCTRALQKKIQETCKDVMKALNITNLGRIDGFLTDQGDVVIIDPNTFSGMAPASFMFREAAYLNMSHTAMINHLIETELHQYGLLSDIIAREQAEQKQEVMQKKKIGVLMGGASNEREISLESGRNITYKLSPAKYEAIPLFLAPDMKLYLLNQQLLVLNSTAQITQALEQAQEISWQDLPTLFDFIFIALHGGVGENGALQGALEMLGMPYNGSSVLTSALCMDKYKTNQFLKAQGFEVPAGLLIDALSWKLDRQKIISAIVQTLPLPLIVKPHDDGCSVMVQKIKYVDALDQALDLIFAHGKEYALVEECIMGMELTVGVIGNEHPRAMPPSQAVCASEILSIEEKFLPGAGENQTPAPLATATLQLVQKIMEEVFRAVGARGYARIDCFYQSASQSTTGKERVIILEINSLPGMTPATCIFHQAAEIGIKPMDFIDMIISLGFQAHACQQKNPAAHATETSIMHVLHKRDVQELK